MNVFITILIPESLAPLARSLAAGLSPAGVGMFERQMYQELSSETYYVSSGLIGEGFAAMIADAELLHAACVQSGAKVTLAQCKALVSQSVVSNGFYEVDGKKVSEDPYALFQRLGLVFVD